jgi:RNA polymerase sigma-70 factor (family 1)
MKNEKKDYLPDKHLESQIFIGLMEDDCSPAVRELDSEILIRSTFANNINDGIELLFRCYYRPLCSHAVRFVSSKEIAEDIVSDIFFKFHSEKIFLKIETSFRSYLYTAVRNRAFDYIRTENRRSISIHSAEFITIDSDQEPDQLTQYEDLYHDVEAAVNGLPSKRRKIYIMHRFEGRKYSEIAQELSLSLRTVEAQMYLATSQIRKAIQQKWFLSFAIFYFL